MVSAPRSQKRTIINRRNPRVDASVGAGCVSILNKGGTPRSQFTDIVISETSEIMLRSNARGRVAWSIASALKTVGPTTPFTECEFVTVR